MQAVPHRHRIDFLLMCLWGGGWATSRTIRERRTEFDQIKGALLPLVGQSCYACPKKATDRHHILPLCRGGKNLPQNLIGLCKRCHIKMSVLNASPEFKKRYPRIVEDRPFTSGVYGTGSLSSAESIVFVPPAPILQPWAGSFRDGYVIAEYLFCTDYKELAATFAYTIRRLATLVLTRVID